MIYFLDRGGIGDLLMRIPYYVCMANKKVDYKIMLPADKVELFRLFLPENHLISVNQSVLSRSALAAMWLRRKYLIDRRSDTLVVAVPYCHKGILRCAENLGIDRTFMYEGESTSKKINVPGFHVISNHYSPDAVGFDAHISRHCDAIFRHICPSLPAYSEIYGKYPKMLDYEDNVSSGYDIVLLTDAGVDYKKYPAENWQAFLDMLPDTLKLIQLGARQMRLSHTGLINNETHSLKEIFSIIEGTPTVIGNDTGFVHWAYMSGAKTICMLGAGDLNRFMPWDSDIFTNLSCIYEKNCRCVDWKCRKTDLKSHIAPCVSTIEPDIIFNEYTEIA